MKDGLGRVQRILVLGGDSDIGVATARAFVRRGASHVSLAGRSREKLVERAVTLQPEGCEVTVLDFDVDAVDSHAAFFVSVFADEGPDVIVLAAGLLGDQSASERDPAAAVALARTNYLGSVSVMVHAAEGLRRRGQGTLVVLSSVAGQRPRRSNFAYGSTKAGLDAFAEGLAFALRDEGVQVLTVRPGFVKTKMTTGLKAAPFATTPEKVASAIVAAVAKGDELIWSPPVLRWVMVVMKLVPRPIFRRLKI
jgi:decaprenylphospho-beta-D-erythro-pentofuranosid-2-ulose 2-reductase